MNIHLLYGCCITNQNVKSLGAFMNIQCNVTHRATTAPTSHSSPTMSYHQLEQNINKWTVQLEDQEKVFLTQATQVNAWDRMLIDNGEMVSVSII